MRKRYVLVLTLALFLAFLIFGCGGSGSNSLYMLSVSRIKKLNDGLLTYAIDWDDGIPNNVSWMDGITPYVDDTEAFRSPAVAGPGYGYALNQDLGSHNLSQFGDREHTLSIFDSTDLGHNAARSTLEQPIPPRYGHTNTLAYLDGHVKDELGENPPPPTLYSQSRTRIGQLNLAMVMYESDYDDYAPLANQWVDQLSPYVGQQRVFRSPLVEWLDPSKYGYAYNIDIAGTKTSEGDPAHTISFFDSIVLTRNATTSTNTLPSPPRYGTKNTIGYADGSVAP